MNTNIEYIRQLSTEESASFNDLRRVHRRRADAARRREPSLEDWLIYWWSRLDEWTPSARLSGTADLWMKVAVIGAAAYFALEFGAAFVRAGR